MSKTSTTLMKSDNYINPTTETRSTQTHTGTTRFLNLNAAFGLISLVCLSFSHVLRWRHIRFGEHFTQNQKLGFHRKVVRFDFAGDEILFPQNSINFASEKGFDFSGSVGNFSLEKARFGRVLLSPLPNYPVMRTIDLDTTYFPPFVVTSPIWLTTEECCKD
ncbi:unnamed protein product [Brassica oleracea var. botrytis]|uniref:Uncharacterized protein n=1 Tax=Brassica oleracea TaxID=3712 RepID=A0A3P6G9L5_BRAOL|nr:unnamed protein product [Brassica oleracea]